MRDAWRRQCCVRIVHTSDLMCACAVNNEMSNQHDIHTRNEKYHKSRRRLRRAE